MAITEVMKNPMVLSTFSAVVSGIIVPLILLSIQKRLKRAERRGEQRRKESMLSLKLQMAGAKLGHASAQAIKSGRMNGELEDAIEAYNDAKTEYYEFMNAHAFENLDK